MAVAVVQWYVWGMYPGCFLGRCVVVRVPHFKFLEDASGNVSGSAPLRHVP